MRAISCWALLSVACPLLAGLVYLLGHLKGERMETAGQGWEVAFYLSPLVFLAVDVALFVGMGFALLGMVLGTCWRWRVQAVVAGLVCAACFFLVPWRW